MRLFSMHQKDHLKIDRFAINILSRMIWVLNISLMVVLYMSSVRATAHAKESDKKEGGGGSIYSTGAKVVPAAVSAKVAVVLGPVKVARLSEKLPVERAVEITKKLDRAFLTEVTKHLNPEKASRIIEQCPDDLLIDVSRRLMEKEEYKVLAGLADHLSPEKLRTLAQKLTASENIRVADHMRDRGLIGKVIVNFSDEYLTELMKVSSQLNSYQLVGDVIQEMDIKRLVSILSILSRIDFGMDAFLKEVIPFIKPERCAGIIEASSDQTLITLLQSFISKNEHALLATLADYLSPDKLRTLATKLSLSDNIKVAGHMKNRRLISRVIAGFSDEYLLGLMDESAKLKSYRMAAEVIQEMDRGRVVSLLEKLSKTSFSLNTFLKESIAYMEPVKYAQIIEASSDQTLITLMRGFSSKNEHALLALLADNLSPVKVKTLATQLSFTDNIKVAGHMKNRALISGVIAGFSDEYLLGLMAESFRLKSYRLAAEVTQEMDKKRVVALLDKLSKTSFPLNIFLKESIAYMEPGKYAQIIEASSDQTLISLMNDFSTKNEHQLLALLADHLSPVKVKTLATRLSYTDNIKVAGHMKNRQLLSRVIAGFSDAYLIDLMTESDKLKSYRLAAEVIQEMDRKRVAFLLEKLSKTDFPLEAFLGEVTPYMDPGTIVEILEAKPDETNNGRG